MSEVNNQESIDQTERAILFGATLRDDLRRSVVSEGHVDWFCSDKHKKLFAAIKTCVERGDCIDHVGILRAARSNNDSSIGDVILDAEWLAKGVCEVKDLDVESLREVHLPFLRTAHQARELCNFGMELTDRSLRQDPSEVLPWASSVMQRIGLSGKGPGAVKIADAIMAQYSRMDANKEKTERLGPLTGTPWLDRINFRLTPHEHTTIAGKPSHGKTVFSTQIAIGVSTQCGVAVVPIEDGENNWVGQYVKQVNGYTIEEMADLGPDHRAHYDLMQYHAKIKDRPIYLATDADGLDTYGIISFLERTKQMDPTLGVCIIDQTYMIKDYSLKQKGETQTEAITRCVTRIKHAADKIGVHVIFLQHVSKKLEGGLNAEPAVNDLCDSYIFEKMSRKIIIIHRPNIGDEENDNTIKVNIAKWTKGKQQVGMLSFDGAKSRIDGFIDPVIGQHETQVLESAFADINFVDNEYTDYSYDEHRRVR